MSDICRQISDNRTLQSGSLFAVVRVAQDGVAPAHGWSLIRTHVVKARAYTPACACVSLIVLEPGERYDPGADHIFIAAYEGPAVAGRREPIVINGRSAVVPALAPGPTPTALRGNTPNRLLLINITPASFALTFVLTVGFAPVQWTGWV